jgi:rSAM/selenodomain-associated transferase 2
MRFSVIVPTYNEAAGITSSLQALIDSIDAASEVEILVSDAGSSDGTREQLQHFPVKRVDAPKGRALQMNLAAKQAQGDYLLFLHADTCLPAGWISLIEQSRADWGFFRVRLSGERRLLKLVATLMNFRSCTTAIATGDQAMFFRREFFQKLNGFPPIPLMEDIAISKHARQYCRPACVAASVRTSSRRWEKSGISKTIGLMWWLRFAYWVGVRPQTLHRWYYG